VFCTRHLWTLHFQTLIYDAWDAKSSFCLYSFIECLKHLERLILVMKKVNLCEYGIVIYYDSQYFFLPKLNVSVSTNKSMWKSCNRLELETLFLGLKELLILFSILKAL